MSFAVARLVLLFDVYVYTHRLNVYTCTHRFYIDFCHISCYCPNGTANPTWGDIFESSKLKARTSLLPRFNEKRRSSFEL